MARKPHEEEEEYYGGGKSGRKRSRPRFMAEEDGDDSNDFGGRKRSEKRDASHFFEIEAAVDSDEGEEEEEGDDDFIVDAGDDIPDEYDSRRIHRSQLLPREDQEEDIEALERKIQARYARSSDIEYYEEATAVEQQALLPSVRDPKLWMVKCETGCEREIADRLMQKCTDRGSELKIRSVVALDHLSNYIYIEAEKEAHVREACNGMHNIYPTKIMQVPIKEIKEMTDVLTVKRKAVDLARDTWVTMKNGNYKGDLAKVVDVDNIRRRVTVKLVPRIDLQALATKLEGREASQKKPFIPPQRFMNIDEAREMNLRVQRKRNHITGDCYEIIGGMLFKDGFLYKSVAMKSVNTQKIQPSVDELMKFWQPGESKDGDMASLSTLSANRKKGHFMKGDPVIVIKGDFKNLKGWVEKVEENIVRIRPEENNLPETPAVRDDELRKCFKHGNHVQVVSGESKGVTGMVVSDEGHVVILVSDVTKKLIHVFADNIVVESTEVISGANQIGDYELHDLVLLHNGSFGVIIGIICDVYKVLMGVPETAEVALARPREIRGKVDKKGSAIDRYNNPLAVKDVVKVVEGRCMGKQGPVEHIYRGVVFIHDCHQLEHAGFICAKGQSCVLAGGSRANNDRKADPFPSRFGHLRAQPCARQSPMRSYRGGPERNVGRRHGGGKGGHDSLRIGTDVKICIGQFKGSKGRVVNLNGSSVRVELEAQMKVVTVERDHIVENVNVRSGYSETQSDPPQTPFHPGGFT